METINYETYVSLEVAKFLKEVGFDWECRKIHYKYPGDTGNWSLEDNYMNHQHTLEVNYCLLAPTLEVAQRYLREVRGIEIQIEVYPDELVGTKWGFYLYNLNICDSIVFQNSCTYNTYEEALETGIKKALEIILEK